MGYSQVWVIKTNAAMDIYAEVVNTRFQFSGLNTQE